MRFCIKPDEGYPLTLPSATRGEGLSQRHLRSAEVGQVGHSGAVPKIDLVILRSEVGRAAAFEKGFRLFRCIQPVLFAAWQR